jgi:hypothetical protein
MWKRLFQKRTTTASDDPHANEGTTQVGDTEEQPDTQRTQGSESVVGRALQLASAALLLVPLRLAAQCSCPNVYVDCSIIPGGTQCGKNSNGVFILGTPQEVYAQVMDTCAWCPPEDEVGCPYMRFTIYAVCLGAQVINTVQMCCQYESCP